MQQSKDFTPGSALFGFFGPLVERIGQGEGLLIPMALSLLPLMPVSPAQQLILGLALVLLMSQLYAFNDWHDTRADLDNPKKNQTLVSCLTRHRKSHIYMQIGFLTLALMLAIVGGGLLSGIALLISVSINVLYSLRYKMIPVVDLIVVGTWGAAYLAVVTTDYRLLSLCALMTFVSHGFQIQVDERSDRQSKITTSAVSFPRTTRGLLTAGILTSILFAAYYFGSAHLFLLPAICSPWFSSSQIGWLMCKASFGTIWLLILVQLYTVL